MCKQLLLNSIPTITLTGERIQYFLGERREMGVLRMLSLGKFHWRWIFRVNSLRCFLFHTTSCQMKHASFQHGIKWDYIFKVEIIYICVILFLLWSLPQNIQTYISIAQIFISLEKVQSLLYDFWKFWVLTIISWSAVNLSSCLHLN